MRGLMDGVWYELEVYADASEWLPETHYTIKDDPERGSFTVDDFEAVS